MQTPHPQSDTPRAPTRQPGLVIEPEHAQAVGERRYLTVMFCDLVDSTGISAKLDPEEWRDLVGAYLEAASAAVTEMGGKVAKKTRRRPELSAIVCSWSAAGPGGPVAAQEAPEKRPQAATCQQSFVKFGLMVCPSGCQNPPAKMAARRLGHHSTGVLG